MKVSFFNNYNQIYSTKQRQPVSAPNLAPLKCDTVSFGALKKTQFQGVDLAVVERFKAPIEKFNNNGDLQIWAINRYEEKKSIDFGGKNNQAKLDRVDRLEEWQKALTDLDYKPTINLLIYDAVTSELKPNNDTLPPVYNEHVLVKTVNEVNEKLKTDAKQPFSFLKMYKTNLKSEILGKDNEPIKEGWLVIPSRTNDPEHFEENVRKLQTFSYDKWCTKSFFAQEYLSKGDFHFYFKDGKPQIGIRFIDNKIEEIQNPENTSIISQEYFEVVKEHITDNGYKLGFVARDFYDKAASLNTKINKAKKNIGAEAIENNDTLKILRNFGVKKDEDGNIRVKKYDQLSPFFTYKDLGIDEDKMFENITSIEGNAIFSRSDLKSLHNLKSIGGNVYIVNSKLSEKDFKDIEIGGEIITNI